VSEISEDGLAQDCNAAVREAFKKAKKKTITWVVIGTVLDLGIRMSHWLFEIPSDVNQWSEGIGWILGFFVGYWFLVYAPVVSVVAFAVEVRNRLIALSERLDLVDLARSGHSHQQWAE